MTLIDELSHLRGRALGGQGHWCGFGTGLEGLARPRLGQEESGVSSRQAECKHQVGNQTWLCKGEGAAKAEVGGWGGSGLRMVCGPPPCGEKVSFLGAGSTGWCDRQTFSFLLEQDRGGGPSGNAA